MLRWEALTRLEAGTLDSAVRDELRGRIALLEEQKDMDLHVVRNFYHIDDGQEEAKE